MYNKDTKLSEVTDARIFKVSWRKFKELDKTCSVEGIKSNECKRLSDELGIDWVN